jgi:peptide/nickel transport system substrate-binding protein
MLAAIVAAAAAIAVLAVGCRREASLPPLRIGLYEPLATLDPHHHDETVVWTLLCNVYDGLVATSPTMGIEPALALAWQQLDPTHVRFTLRPGVRFHDGSPFSSADVVATWRRTQDDPRCKVGHYLHGVTDIRADGELAVIVETEAHVPNLLARLANLFIVSARDAALPEISEPNGTGPYRWTGPADGGGVELTAWHGWHGPPAIGRVVFASVGDDQDRLEMLEHGRLDICLRVPDDRVAEVRAIEGLRVEAQPRLSVQMVSVCADAATGKARAALADPRVRRAMLLASDRSDLVRAVLRGDGTVAAQYVHPAVFGYDPDLQPLPFDLDAARALMREAGFPHGFTVELGHGTGVGDIAAHIAADLSKIGIAVVPLELPYPELVARARAHRVPLVYHGWSCVTGDASDFFEALVHSRDVTRGLGLENYSGYSDRKLDALIERADSEPDRERRLAFLHEAQRRVLADLPILPFTFRWWFIGISSRVDVVIRHDSWLRVADYSWR